MKLDKKALIAIAIGWYVLFTVLLATTQNSVSSLNSIISIFRVVFHGLQINSITLSFGFAGSAILLALLILLLIYLLRVWQSVIRLTRVLVRFVFFDEGTSTNDDFSDKKTATEAQVAPEKEMLFSLFGKNVMKSNNGLFWLSLRSFMIIWAIIIVIALVSGFVSAVLGF